MTVVTALAPTSPYKGLAPFEDSDLDALLFFGRERESEVIAANLMAARITVLYGPSGVGKSSVLRAGVMHRLRREEGTELTIFSSWTGDPVRALVETVGGTGDSLADAFLAAAAPAGGELYLILDQFEECFLYHPRGGRFAEQLADVMRRPDVRVNVLIGIREDALAQLDLLKAAIPNLLSNRLRLERLDRVAGADAILGPVNRYNGFVDRADAVSIEPELVNEVLEEVTAGRVELSVAGRGVAVNGGDENRIEAPYLQLVLARLWEVEAERGSHVLRRSTLGELGGAERIVHDHLERAMAALSPREKSAAASMYNFLVTPSGTKIAHGISDLAGYAAVNEHEASAVLQRLSAERIVRASSENGPSTTRYEIFHDVLADAVLAWRARFEAERALDEERERHRRRHRRLIVIGIVALLAVAVLAAIAIYALHQRSETQHQASVARAQQARAERSAKTANDALAKEARATQRARANERKYRQAAAQAEAERQRASSAAVSENHARRNAEAAEGVAKAQALRARQQTALQILATHRAERAEARTTNQRNIVRAEKLEAQARLLLTEDAVKSVGRSLAAIAAYRTAHIRPTVRVENTLRDGILGLRLRAVLRLPKGGPVHVVRFSPDGSLAFVGGNGGAALFDRNHGFRARPLLPNSDIADAAFSPDGTLVAGAGGGKNDRFVHVWDVRTGAQVLALEHQGPVTAVAFSPNGQLIASGSADGTARLWSVVGGLEVASFAHEPGARGKTVQHVEFSSDGSRLLTVGGNRFVRVFDVARRTELFALNNVALVNTARFSHDGNLIATAGAIEAVRLWNARTGALISVLDLTGRVSDLAFSPDDALLATAGSNDTVGRIFNLAQESPVGTISAHRSGVESIVFTPDGRSVITTGRDGRAIISGVSAGFPEASLAGHTRSVEGAELAPDGALVATWSDDGTARVWNARVGAYAHDVGTHELPPSTKRGPVVAFSPAGRYMLSAGADGTAHLWGARTRLRVLEHDGPVNSASFSRNGRFVITGSDDGSAHVWRVPSGRLVAALPHGAAVTVARLTPNGRFAVTGGSDGRVGVWDVGRKRVVRRYELGGVINDAELSRDGRFAVAASSNGTAAVYGVDAASEVILRGHTDEVVAAVFSPGGKRVATASADGTARIWNAHTGASSQPLIGHTAGLTALAFNNDGTRLATTGIDADIRIWNGRTGAEVTVLRAHSGSVNDLAFSADGRWLASAGPLAAAIWETSSWPGTPLYFVYGDAARTPRLDHVAFSPRGWRLLTGWRGGAVRLFNCTACGGVRELQAIARARLREVVRVKS
jgi:WD40 repeat protein